MRKQLQDLQARVDAIDVDNLYQATHDIQRILDAIIELLDKALPTEVEPD